uniref:Uncharacterized protein n=1 Tax=Steinernema glaseri TaxID=37863 RepID=A0A1I7ZGN4_9BILA
MRGMRQPKPAIVSSSPPPPSSAHNHLHNTVRSIASPAAAAVPISAPQHSFPDGNDSVPEDGPFPACQAALSKSPPRDVHVIQHGPQEVFIPRLLFVLSLFGRLPHAVIFDLTNRPSMTSIHYIEFKLGECFVAVTTEKKRAAAQLSPLGVVLSIRLLIDVLILRCGFIFSHILVPIMCVLRGADQLTRPAMTRGLCHHQPIAFRHNPLGADEAGERASYQLDCDFVVFERMGPWSVENNGKTPEFETQRVLEEYQLEMILDS